MKTKIKRIEFMSLMIPLSGEKDATINLFLNQVKVDNKEFFEIEKYVSKYEDMFRTFIEEYRKKAEKYENEENEDKKEEIKKELKEYEEQMIEIDMIPYDLIKDKEISLLVLSRMKKMFEMIKNMNIELSDGENVTYKELSVGEVNIFLYGNGKDIIPYNEFALKPYPIDKVLLLESIIKEMISIHQKYVEKVEELKKKELEEEEFKKEVMTILSKKDKFPTIPNFFISEIKLPYSYMKTLKELLNIKIDKE